MPISIYPTASTSAFYTKLQADGVHITELIELDLPGGYSRRWTTSNQNITYTLSGVATEYVPFQGGTRRGIEESADLGVSIIDFIMINTSDEIQGMLASDDFTLAGLKVGRVFTDTPDLGRMQIYEGQVGDFIYNRQTITGQARNLWKSANINWPYYTYREKCVWRFGGHGCGFNTSSITISINTTAVQSFDGINIYLNSGTLTASYSAGRFNFGRCSIIGGSNSGHMRTIRQHSGDVLALSHPLPSAVQTGLRLSIFPGCNKRLIEDCRSLYNNDENFMGWPWILVQEDAFR